MDDDILSFVYTAFIAFLKFIELIAVFIGNHPIIFLPADRPVTIFRTYLHLLSISDYPSVLINPRVENILVSVFALRFYFFESVRYLEKAFTARKQVCLEISP